jgi:hypothetical protein
MQHMSTMLRMSTIREPIFKPVKNRAFRRQPGSQAWH